MPEVLIEYAATAWKAMMASSDPLPSLPNDLVRSISVLPSLKTEVSIRPPLLPSSLLQPSFPKHGIPHRHKPTDLSSTSYDVEIQNQDAADEVDSMTPRGKQHGLRVMDERARMSPGFSAWRSCRAVVGICSTTPSS